MRTANPHKNGTDSGFDLKVSDFWFYKIDL